MLEADECFGDPGKGRIRVDKLGDELRGHTRLGCATVRYHKLERLRKHSLQIKQLHVQCRDAAIGGDMTASTQHVRKLLRGDASAVAWHDLRSFSVPPSEYVAGVWTICQ